MKQRQKDRHRSTMVLIPALLITASVLPGDHPSFPRGRPEKTRSAPAVQVSTSIARTTRQRIELIEARLREKPSDPGLLAALASAYMNRARVTSEASWYSRAEAACRKSLEIAPGNYDALRLQPWILAGQHRFAEAAEAAKAAIKIRPFDPWNYGTLGDALVELGNYDGAAEAFQKMIDMRPDSASYSRAAYMRELAGDTEGAIEAMSLALASADPFDRETLAWFRTQLGDLRFSMGDLQGAAAEYQNSLALDENSHAALGGLARVRAAQGDLDQAVGLYNKALSIVPVPSMASEYGDLLVKLGRTEEAKHEYDLVEITGRIQSSTTGLFDRQVAIFRADHGTDPDGALAIAERELMVRKDIYGYDAVAWCSLKAGKIGRARQAMQEALRLGARDARLHYHAGMIALAAGRHGEARRHLRRALAINPHFDLRGADDVRSALRSLEE